MNHHSELKNLIDSVNANRIDVSALVLPRPNIYWITIASFSGQLHNVFLAADNSTFAIRKAVRWTRQNHGWRPTEGNSVIKTKRFTPQMLVSNLDAWVQAMQMATANGESDLVIGLQGYVKAFRSVVDAPMSHMNYPSREAFWGIVGDELEKMGAPVRILR